MANLSAWRRNVAALGWFCSLAFLLLVVALHVVDPGRDPSKELISQYEMGPHGRMMSFAFLCLGAGVASWLAASRMEATSRSTVVGRALFWLIAVALAGASVFLPLPTAGTESSLHTLCGLVVVLSFPWAAALHARGLATSPQWQHHKVQLWGATAGVWLGWATFVGSIMAFHPTSAEDKAGLAVGWQNRFMMFTYALWLLVMLGTTFRMPGPTPRPR